MAVHGGRTFYCVPAMSGSGKSAVMRRPRLKLAVAVLRPPAPSGQRLTFALCQPALRNSIRTEARLPAPQRGIVAGHATASASWSNATPTWGEDWRRRTRAACQLRGLLPRVLGANVSALPHVRPAAHVLTSNRARLLAEFAPNGKLARSEVPQQHARTQDTGSSESLEGDIGMGCPRLPDIENSATSSSGSTRSSRRAGVVSLAFSMIST